MNVTKGDKAAKVAVVGAGISGLSAAYYLTRQGYEVTVLESDTRIGGHTATIDVETSLGPRGIDTGFIVYNDWTYPNFIELLDELRVATQPTTMGFSVSCEATGLEYAGGTLNSLFAQRRNLLSPAFLRMVRDILRFNKQAVADLQAGRIEADMPLMDYLEKNAYGDFFVEKYLVPMGAAIWSSGLAGMRDFPVAFFVEFFKNHGLLQVMNRPQWRVVMGGSRSYIKPLVRPFRRRIVTSAVIDQLSRDESGVRLRFSGVADGSAVSIDQHYDAMVVATHSDQAIELVDDMTSEERAILSAIPYQSNDVVLHTDKRLLPVNTKTWSSWNYRLASGAGNERALLTYNMNILQGLDTPETYCVSLNLNDAIDEKKVIGQYQYSHPVFTVAGEAAKARWHEIAGTQRTWYCGAYWRNGFHEDGVYSARRAVESLHAQLGSLPSSPMPYPKRDAQKQELPA